MKDPTPSGKVEGVRIRCAMTQTERDLINVLTPSERLAALLDAARHKLERLLKETEGEKSRHD